jgi:hypothetical protein
LGCPTTQIKNRLNYRLMKIIKSLFITAFALAFCTGSIFAQVQQQQPQQQQMPDLPTSADVSDEEVALLVNTIHELEPIEQETQEKIEEAVEAEDISFERFQQMMMAMQNPQMADEMDVTDEEMEKIQTLQPTLMEIQSEAEQEMIAKIEENGLTMDRYREIIMGAQQDPELMQRLQSELGIEE